MGTWGIGLKEYRIVQFAGKTGVGKMKITLTICNVAVLFAASTALAFNEQIMLPQYSFVHGANFVRATGSWIGDSPESGDPYFNDFALQTTELSCDRGRGVCTEARAVWKAPVLLSYLNEYKIAEWTSDYLVAVLDGSAAKIEITFDFNKKLVLLTHKEKTKSTMVNKLPDRAHLDDGAKVVQKTLGKSSNK